MESEPAFAKAVRDALVGLYDAVVLETSPLLDSFDLRARAADAPGHLRQLLREAIESLKPPPSVPFGDPEWLGYRLLWLKYVRRQARHEICDQLGISERSYYRFRRRSLEAVTSLLWQRRAWPPASSPLESFQPPMVSGTAIREAVDLARHSVRQRIQVSTLLAATRPIATALAERHEVAFQVEFPSNLITVRVDPAILRQVLLGVLSDAMGAAPQSALALEVSEESGEAVFSFIGPATAILCTEGMDERPGIQIGHGVLGVYGGRLWVDHEGHCQPVLRFSVPSVAAPTILIIEDDLDTAELYRRFLESHGYALEVAQNAKEVAERISVQCPELIILDVLMPQEDGWDILLDLRSKPRTSHVPVVICSVLDQPDLALAMGAAHVLNKPVGTETLLGVVKQVLALQGTGD